METDSVVVEGEPRFRTWVLGMFAAAWVVLLAAIWTPQYLPLFDLPNHMARHYLEYRHLIGRDLADWYQIRLAILPNLGTDLIAPPLFFLFSPLIATKVLVTICVFLYWGGVTAFIASRNGAGASSAVASIFFLPWILNNQLFLGFLNFYSGLGLAFLLLVFFCRLGESANLRPLGLLAITLAACLLFLWHLGAWFIYGILAGCFWLASVLGWASSDRRDTRRWIKLAALAATMIPSLLMLAYYLHANPGGGAADWGRPVRKLTFLFSAFRSYIVWMDAAAMLLWAGALATTYGLTRIVKPRPDWLLLGFVVLFVAFLALPVRSRNMDNVDGRLIPALLVVAIASLGRLTPRHLALGSILLVGALGVRSASVITSWHRLSGRLAAESRLLDQFEPGSRVLPVLFHTFEQDHPEYHFVCSAVTERNAYVPTLFAARDQQPIRLVYHPPQAVAIGPDGNLQIDAQKAAQGFDYAWVFNPGHRPVPIPATWQKLDSVNDVSVWKIH